MSPHCHECQDRLLSRTSESDALSRDLRAHLDSCTVCAKFAASALILRRGFGDLSRHAALAELDGRVVAAFHAGYRQARAVSHVAHLSRWNVPGELDRKVLEPRALERSTAPDVLDRLVSEDLRDPSKAIARRFAGRLARLAAPTELRRRVERVFGPRDVTRARRSPRILHLVAAVLIVALGGSVLWTRGRSERPRYSFEVRRESVHASSDPLLRGMLSGLSGGLIDAAQGGPR